MSISKLIAAVALSAFAVGSFAATPAVSTTSDMKVTTAKKGKKMGKKSAKKAAPAKAAAAK